MTIIVGTRYAQGIVVGYDTINLRLINNIIDNKYLPAGYIEKFRQIKTGGQTLGAGIAGLANKEYFLLIEDEIKKNKNVTKGINSFLSKNRLDGYESTSFPAVGQEFIFGDAKGFRIPDSVVNQIGFRQDYVGIGRGYYPAVEEFIRNNHDPKSSFDDALDLIKKAIDISKVENREDPEYINGGIIKGMGLVRIANNKYDILEFSKR